MDNSVFGNIPNDETAGQTISYVCSGGTSDCYRVNRFGRWFFMKRLKPEYAGDIRYVQAFRKEIELGMKINHPNIVAYYNFQEDEKGPYILLDMVDGVSLSDFVSNNPSYFLSKKHRRQFLKELLSAVSCLHFHQILHLDLKPDNILITSQDFHVKIIDLGMSYQDSHPTNFGGSGDFSAPELFDSENVRPTPACDIYSIGRLMKFIGEPCGGVINRCTDTVPSHRYQSVEELENAVRQRDRLRKMTLVACVLALIVGTVLFCRLHFRAVIPTSEIAHDEMVTAPESSDDSEKQPMNNQRPEDYSSNLDKENREYATLTAEYENKFQASLNHWLPQLEAYLNATFPDSVNDREDFFEKGRTLSATMQRAMKEELALADAPYTIQSKYGNRIDSIAVAFRTAFSERRSRYNSYVDNSLAAENNRLMQQLLTERKQIFKPVDELIASPSTNLQQFYRHYCVLRDSCAKELYQAIPPGEITGEQQGKLFSVVRQYNDSVRMIIMNAKKEGKDISWYLKGE